MDFISHAFWTAMAAKTVNRKTQEHSGKKSKKIIWATLWGIAPDVFAFAPLAISFILAFLLGIGDINIHNLPRPSEFEPANQDTLAVFKLTRLLYDISHSIVIFGLVFIAVKLIRKKPNWVMLGWLFHILIDIPTHSYAFYPTPLFWPLAKWKFDGMSWDTSWFMAINFSAMALIMVLYLWRKKNKARR